MYDRALLLKFLTLSISNFTSNAIALDEGVLGYGTQGGKQAHGAWPA